MHIGTYLPTYSHVSCRKHDITSNTIRALADLNSVLQISSAVKLLINLLVNLLVNNNIL